MPENLLRRRSQITRDPAQKGEVNRLQMSVSRRLNKWRNDQWNATLECLNAEDQSLWKMTKRVMTVPTPSTPFSPRWIRTSRPLTANQICPSQTRFE